MHDSSWQEMREVLRRHVRPVPLLIADVGSMSVNKAFPHTYREHMHPRWTYEGWDLAEGPNVDHVMPDPYTLPVADATYDVVLSGQCLEHVCNPFRWAAELTRTLKPAGLLILTAPWRQDEHRYPIDCWRILPDGMDALLAECGLTRLESYRRENDCWGIALKPDPDADALEPLEMAP